MLRCNAPSIITGCDTDMKRAFLGCCLLVVSAVALVFAQEFDDVLTDAANARGVETQEFWEVDPSEAVESYWNDTSSAAKRSATGCNIYINNNGQTNPPPLLIHPNTERFMHPTTRDGVVRMGVQQRVELFCSVAFAAPFASAPRPLIATCLGHNLFAVHGHHGIALSTVRCSAHARHVDRRVASATCGGGGSTLLELGFHVTPTRFLRLMEVCHDERTHSTLWTRFRLTPATIGFQRAFPRPGFIKGSFFGPLNVNQMYTGATQRQTMTRILGARRVAELFDNSRNFFLARGHLAAKTDFIFGTEQRGTFFFVNAAPQWQSFNAGNWERIEFGVKHYVANRKLDVRVYTGTYGVLRMRDDAGVLRELYLGFDSSGRGQIPVPMYFYKVIVEERTGRGIVFIGLNNPHASEASVRAGHYNLCRDVGDRVAYVNWNRKSIARGYSYACEVNEFVRVVAHLPAGIRATGLLL